MGYRKMLLPIDLLIEVEGDEPALGSRFSINQLLEGALSFTQRALVQRDLETIEHWQSVYLRYRGCERSLLELSEPTIKVWRPPINGHLIADGFHRLAAAKLAGLSAIAAWLAPTFHDLPL